ncbi:hypothetical protein P8864_16775 [Priestia flexa]|uniref:hypothetical protein n=1 Tax=Priestia flexa TaxID=86664 RepID=UPI002DB7ACF8|nr:hypothetical protein [Priestia flexa]MEC0667515.1 hypothetical protein [Priestia flexa]
MNLSIFDELGLFSKKLQRYYSLNINAVERILRWLKVSVITNRFHATRKDIPKSIDSFMEYLNAYPKKVIQRIGSQAMSEN